MRGMVCKSPIEVWVKNILIADDEASLRCLIQATLEGPEIHTTQAVCGADALRMATEKNFDLIILDWMMPGMSGIEVLQQLRAQRQTAQIPVVMLTARGQMKDQEQALRSGANEYVMKPFSPLELLEKITSILDVEEEEPGRGAVAGF